MELSTLSPKVIFCFSNKLLNLTLKVIFLCCRCCWSSGFFVRAKRQAFFCRRVCFLPSFFFSLPILIILFDLCDSTRHVWMTRFSCLGPWQVHSTEIKLSFHLSVWKVESRILRSANQIQWPLSCTPENLQRGAFYFYFLLNKALTVNICS